MECARIAYLDDGASDAARLGFSYQAFGNRGVRCWLGRKGGKAVVAVRGTVWRKEGERNFDHNLKTDLVPWMGPGRVHEGYHRALWSLLPAIRAHLKGAERVFFTGHSMGAAIAVLAGGLCGGDRVFCFASPRVGDEVFVRGLNARLRVTRYENRNDLVTRYPLFGSVRGQKDQTALYCHVGRAVRLKGFGHSMNAYLRGMQQRAGATGIITRPEQADT
ncbi:hypothetical protein GCM10007924_27220 [Sneathiella chinensis]|uniref:Fungal lipase-type domain-containing protein n=1 Tax=Sneathiella chinensis TaxID=349750 RepID=A0ABQ5U6U2_9PROT|nr:hypothetical protein GCM10007924_27220 [Sneathiella chinensis]